MDEEAGEPTGQTNETVGRVVTYRYNARRRLIRDGRRRTSADTAVHTYRWDITTGELLPCSCDQQSTAEPTDGEETP